MTTNEQIIIDGKVKNCKILFECNSVDDLASFIMMRAGVEITPDNAPVFDNFNIRLIAEPRSPYGFSSLFKRNENIDEWEYMGFGHSGACSVVTALLKQLQPKTAECEELQKLCQNQEKTINDLTGCVGLWEEFSEKESELAKNSSIADLVVLLREARSSLESKTTECEELKKILSYPKYTNEFAYNELLKLSKEELIKNVIESHQHGESVTQCVYKPLKEENTKYKQALDEIEKIAKQTRDEYMKEKSDKKDYYNAMIYGLGGLTQILDIISEAKGVDNHG